jgi:hypothetical protein
MAVPNQKPLLAFFTLPVAASRFRIPALFASNEVLSPLLSGTPKPKYTVGLPIPQQPTVLPPLTGPMKRDGKLGNPKAPESACVTAGTAKTTVRHTNRNSPFFMTMSFQNKQKQGNTIGYPLKFKSKPTCSVDHFNLTNLSQKTPYLSDDQFAPSMS